MICCSKCRKQAYNSQWATSAEKVKHENQTTKPTKHQWLKKLIVKVSQKKTQSQVHISISKQTFHFYLNLAIRHVLCYTMWHTHRMRPVYFLALLEEPFLRVRIDQSRQWNSTNPQLNFCQTALWFFTRLFQIYFSTGLYLGGFTFSRSSNVSPVPQQPPPLTSNPPRLPLVPADSSKGSKSPLFASRQPSIELAQNSHIPHPDIPYGFEITQGLGATCGSLTWNSVPIHVVICFLLDGIEGNFFFSYTFIMQWFGHVVSEEW